jgi:hypothetical protein
MGDKGKKDKGRREQQKKAKLNLKEKRNLSTLQETAEHFSCKIASKSHQDDYGKTRWWLTGSNPGAKEEPAGQNSCETQEKNIKCLVGSVVNIYLNCVDKLSHSCCRWTE